MFKKLKTFKKINLKKNILKRNKQKNMDRSRALLLLEKSQGNGQLQNAGGGHPWKGQRITMVI